MLMMFTLPASLCWGSSKILTDYEDCNTVREKCWFSFAHKSSSTILCTVGTREEGGCIPQYCSKRAYKNQLFDYQVQGDLGLAS